MNIFRASRNSLPNNSMFILFTPSDTCVSISSFSNLLLSSWHKSIAPTSFSLSFVDSVLDCSIFLVIMDTSSSKVDFSFSTVIISFSRNDISDSRSFTNCFNVINCCSFVFSVTAPSSLSPTKSSSISSPAILFDKHSSLISSFTSSFIKLLLLFFWANSSLALHRDGIPSAPPNVIRKIDDPLTTSLSSCDDGPDDNPLF
mmetsp:Transcript_6445/g.9475  ORF Transcript_6445/g.9475 Transcript_6445/m.9475 type:complete len:201 (+) Transcript_6445:386-988(+)